MTGRGTREGLSGVGNVLYLEQMCSIYRHSLSCILRNSVLVYIYVLLYFFKVYFRNKLIMLYT